MMKNKLIQGTIIGIETVGVLVFCYWLGNVAGKDAGKRLETHFIN